MCYWDLKCTAPAIAVHLRDRFCSDESDYVNIAICGPHAREAMRLGFRTYALYGSMNIRGMRPDIDAEAESLPGLSQDVWTEFRLAPRDWCDTGCKIHAKRHSNGVTIWLRHSRTYGCPVGV